MPEDRPRDRPKGRSKSRPKARELKSQVLMSQGMPKRDVLVLVPARMASQRLPGRRLADIPGQPMIVRILRRAPAGPENRNNPNVVTASGSPAATDRLRGLAARMHIDGTIVTTTPLGVDTPEDLATARQMLRAAKKGFPRIRQ